MKKAKDNNANRNNGTDRPAKKLQLRRQSLRKLTLTAEQLQHAAGGMYIDYTY